MTEGYFIRIDNGEVFPVKNHEMDVRNKEFSRKLGVSNADFAHFAKYTPVEDRKEFLFWLLRQARLIRVRGYGIWVAIQYSSANDKQALQAIHRWGKKVCGPCLMLRITNIKTGKQFNSFWLPFDEAMKKGKRIKSVPVEVTK
jgi:hypothetical protein